MDAAHRKNAEYSMRQPVWSAVDNFGTKHKTAYATNNKCGGIR